MVRPPVRFTEEYMNMTLLQGMAGTAGPGYGHGGHGWLGMGWFPGGGLIGLLILVALVVLVLRLLRPGRAGHDTPEPASTETPRDILKRRYAVGELTREEYQRMSKDIGEEES